ncbi:MAG: DUF3419 family protein [Nannocystaceae bacterium]
MLLRDWTFEKLFRTTMVYNILHEDTDVDEAHLGIDEGSRILAISGAGCGVAGHLARNPQRIDAVDINPHHLALTALKTSAARRLSVHDDLYALFGFGSHLDAERLLRHLCAPLPRWIASYWRERWRLFYEGSILQEGLAARLFAALRWLAGVDAGWLRRLSALTPEERHLSVDGAFAEVLQTPWVRAAIHSPVNLVALGINYCQRDRLLAAEGLDFVGYLLAFLKRIAETDLERNWFAWHAVAGHFNHSLPEAVPPYLRRDHHAQSRRATTATAFHRANIFEVLSRAGRGTWTHYTLCDAVDWMPPRAQRALFHEIVRTAAPGARVLTRSVEPGSAVERVGMGRWLRLDAEASRQATLADRTRHFRRVDFYEVAR